MRKKLGLRRYAGLTGGHRRYVGLTTVMAVAALVFVPLALAGAISSTTNPAVDNGGTGTPTLCLNGGVGANTGAGATNCNIYTSKAYVWLSGLPLAGSLDPGTYFYAVLDPGGQRSPNDGTTGNLSDNVDPWTNREFTIDSSGNLALANSSTHDLANNGIRVGLSSDWFANTDNNGDVYILAVCAVPDPVSDSPGVRPQDCKYDAFKVSQTDTTPPATDLGVSKTAATSLTRTHNWTIAKSVDACAVVNGVGGCNITGTTKTLNYTVTVTKDATAAVDSAWTVAGHIDVENDNSYAITGVAVSDDINDSNSRDICTVQDGSYGSTTGVDHTGATIPALTTVRYEYTCSYTLAPSESSQTNTATVSWDASNGLPHNSATGTATVDWTAATVTDANNSTTVSDVISSTVPSTLPAGFLTGTATGDVPDGTTVLTASHTYNYSRTLTVPNSCLTVTNTATLSAGGSSAVTAKVCRTAPNTGALTIGFWQNKNGQGIITNYCAGTLQSTHTPITIPQTSLASFLGGYNPYSDFKIGTKAYATSCTGLASYAYDLIKAANASGAAMNAMLKAQMLATALDVYFSDPNLGGNKINAAHPIGGVVIDLTQICKMIDGSGGTATCGAVYQNVSAAFGGATQLTVSAMLAYAAGQSNVGGSTWYANVKATQEMAKNAFDAINNQVAFSP
jgi:hypothetical protein